MDLTVLKEYYNDEVYLQAVSNNGEKIGNNILVKSKLYDNMYNLAMNISDSNEVLICYYTKYSAGLRIYNKDLNPVSTGSNILTSTSTQYFDPIAVSVDKDLNLFAVWQNYNSPTHERSKKIYGQFFNKNTSKASNIITLDSTNGYIFNLKCANEGINNYALVYKNDSNLHIIRNYNSTEDIHFRNQDPYYTYSPGNINIVRFRKQKIVYYL